MLTLALGALLAAFSPQDPLALVGGVLHDGSGGPPLTDSVVILRNGHIEKVGKRDAVSIPDGLRVIDVHGRHITPGLIDTHVHYSQTGWADGRPDARDVRATHPYEVAMAENAAHPERFHLAFLHSGVTAVFDVGGYPWTRLLRAATENDPLAPHVSAAGALFTAFEATYGQTQFGTAFDDAARAVATRTRRRAENSPHGSAFPISSQEHHAACCEACRPVPCHVPRPLPRQSSRTTP